MKTDIIKLLDDLAELQAHQALLGIDKKKAVDGIMTPELQAQLDAIDLEFAPKLEAVSEKMATLEKQIKGLVKMHRQSVKAEFLHAVFSQRTNWDGKRLLGYAEAHPEVLKFSRTSTSVSIRRTKGD